jgi:hypothetical protein
MPDTPMTEVELRLAVTNVDHALVFQYQQKMGSILYVAIMTRPDVAFLVSRLARFNQNPTSEHHDAVNQVIHFLYGMKHMAIYYGRDTRQKGAQVFICAGNALFTDNTEDRKSLQGYIMMLFNGPIS